MKSKLHTFDGVDATVTWDRKRCIHFEACVHGLPNVFDPQRRPWIEPDQADAEALQTVVERCPTGALHLRLANGEDPEVAPTHARVTVAPNGPLYVHGDVTIRDAEGEVLLRDTRVALCRCGLSGNKPLCDNSHLDRFQDAGRLSDTEVGGDAPPSNPALSILPRTNGPLVVEGPMTLVGSAGEVARAKALLCRCGQSGNRPFCDGSHKRVGFDSA